MSNLPINEKDLLHNAENLRLEAQRLLDSGLLETLEKVTPCYVHGSYALDLLIKRDLDITICLDDEHDYDTFFQLGAAITRAYPVHKASYSNHFTRGFPGFDYGLYWGIELGFEKERWKLDLWGLGKENYTEYRKKFQRLKTSLANCDRLTILRLKKELAMGKGYRSGVTSMTIYKAVLEGITRLEEFEQWKLSETVH